MRTNWRRKMRIYRKARGEILVEMIFKVERANERMSENLV